MRLCHVSCHASFSSLYFSRVITFWDCSITVCFVSHGQDLWPILSPVSWSCETCVRVVHDWVLVLYGQMFFVYGNCLICVLLLPTRYSVDQSFFIWIRPFSHRYISLWTLNAILIVSFLITSNQFKRKLNLVDNNVRGCYSNIYNKWQGQVMAILLILLINILPDTKAYHIIAYI